MYSKAILLSILTITLFGESRANTQLNKVVKQTKQILTIKANNTATIKKNKLSISEATIKAINSAREKNQICSKAVQPLRWNQSLYQRVKEHSIDMAVNEKLSHIGSGTKTDITAQNLGLQRGSYFYERVNQKKDSKKILSAEIIIRTDKNSLKSPKDLVSYWITKEKDCKVIMDPRFSDVALSKVISNKDSKAYWTLMLIGKREK